jgi:hypothetical protein
MMQKLRVSSIAIGKRVAVSFSRNQRSTVQTRFHLNKQVLQMVLLSAVALALPVGLVVYALVPRKSQVAAQDGAEGLRQTLETLAKDGLPEPALAGGPVELTLMVADPSQSGIFLKSLATEMGGSAVEATEGRLLISLPGSARDEFVRRAELYTGADLSPIPASGAEVLVLTLTPADAR